MAKIIRLGRHTLLHGDCRLWPTFGRRSYGCVIFDPPWDDAVAQTANTWLPRAPSMLTFTDAQRFGDPVRTFGAPTWVFTWNTMAPWNVGQRRPLKQTKHALWYGTLDHYQRDAAMWGDPPPAHEWAGRTYRPDPRGRRLTDLYTASLRWLHAPGTAGGKGWHPHEKPSEWVRCLIGNTSTGPVLDTFAGSGSTLMAAEALGRTAYLIEKDAATVDTIVTRWEASRRRSKRPTRRVLAGR